MISCIIHETQQPAVILSNSIGTENKHWFAHKTSWRRTPNLPFTSHEINFEDSLQRSISPGSISSTNVKISVRLSDIIGMQSRKLARRSFNNLMLHGFVLQI